jgi:hypothetical protein
MFFKNLRAQRQKWTFLESQKCPFLEKFIFLAKKVRLQDKIKKYEFNILSHLLSFDIMIVNKKYKISVIILNFYFSILKGIFFDVNSIYFMNSFIL